MDLGTVDLSGTVGCGTVPHTPRHSRHIERNPPSYPS
jgi:hypothetical protein